MKEGKQPSISYDAQRILMERRLETTKLENSMLNHPEVTHRLRPRVSDFTHTDSYSGNEADWVVISVVRTEKVGFPQQHAANERRIRAL